MDQIYLSRMILKILMRSLKFPQIAIIQIIEDIGHGINLRMILRAKMVMRVRRAWGPLRQNMQQVPRWHQRWKLVWGLWHPRYLSALDFEAACELQIPHRCPLNFQRATWNATEKFLRRSYRPYQEGDSSHTWRRNGSILGKHGA